MACMHVMMMMYIRMVMYLRCFFVDVFFDECMACM